MNDAKIDVVHRKSSGVRLNKQKNINFIQSSVERAKNTPGVGSYETLESYKKVQMTPSLRRQRI